MIISVYNNHIVKSPTKQVAEQVAKKWAKYPTPLKECGDHLHNQQEAGRLMVVAGKDYYYANGGINMRKGTIFIVGR